MITQAYTALMMRVNVCVCVWYTHGMCIILSRFTPLNTTHSSKTCTYQHTEYRRLARRLCLLFTQTHNAQLQMLVTTSTNSNTNPPVMFDRARANEIAFSLSQLLLDAAPHGHRQTKNSIYAMQKWRERERERKLGGFADAISQRDSSDQSLSTRRATCSLCSG